MQPALTYQLIKILHITRWITADQTQAVIALALQVQVELLLTLLTIKET